MSKKARETEEVFPSFECPNCKKGTILINKTEYELKDGDKMLILKFECNQCAFTNNDIIPMTTRTDPGIMTLRVTEETDLKSKIYRSPIARLEIPELELAVDPGPSAKFYFTNVEGVLFRFEEAVSIYKNSLEEGSPETKDIEELLLKIDRALKGLLHFTLKITDTGGGSYIIPTDNSKYSFKTIEVDNKE